MGGLYSRSGRFGEGKSILSLAQFKHDLGLQVKFKHISVVNILVAFCCKLHSNRRLVLQPVISLSRTHPLQTTHSQFEEIFCEFRRIGQDVLLKTKPARRNYKPTHRMAINDLYDIT